MRIGSNLFLRADGRWEARYQKARDDQGKIVYGFVYGTTQEEAEQKRIDAIQKISNGLENIDSVLPSVNPNVFCMNEMSGNKQVKIKEKIEQPFSEQEVIVINNCLMDSKEPATIAFFLALHMGLSLSELVALKYGDIDLDAGVVRISNAIQLKKDGMTAIQTTPRRLIIPPFVKHYLKCHMNPYAKNNFYIFTGTETCISSNQTIGAAFRRIIKHRLNDKHININSLRSTFIKRCLEKNINIETVSYMSGLDRALIYRYYGKYITVNPQAILRLEEGSQENENRQLNLLILGAGSHGHSVKETAEKLGVFQKIRFLDDNVSANDVLDICSSYRTYLKEYPAMFPAFGDNELRREWIKRLRSAGVIIPRLIHPDTTISPGVEIKDATIILSQVTVNSGVKIGEGCIVAANSMIGFGATVEDYVHLDSGVILQKNATVSEMSDIESGEIVRA